MARKKEQKPTHRATLATGETVDYHGAHPTHWTFGGTDEEGNRDLKSRVRTVPVASVHPLSAFADAVPNPDRDDDEDEQEDEDEVEDGE